MRESSEESVALLLSSATVNVPLPSWASSSSVSKEMPPSLLAIVCTSSPSVSEEMSAVSSGTESFTFTPSP